MGDKEFEKLNILELKAASKVNGCGTFQGTAIDLLPTIKGLRVLSN